MSCWGMLKSHRGERGHHTSASTLARQVGPTEVEELCGLK